MGASGEPIAVRLKPGVTVSGQVLTPDGKPLAGANVNVAGLSTGDSRYSKSTDAEGRFTIVFPNIQFDQNAREERKYSIVVMDPKGRFANTISAPLKANAGDKNEIQLTMSSGPRVRGQVLNPDGDPVARVEVEAVCDDQMDAWYFNPRALTDERGNFDLGPMRAGHYTIQADTNFGVNIMQEPRQPTVEVDLAAGGKSLDIELIYTGPTPPPVPEWYLRSFGNREVPKE